MKQYIKKPIPVFAVKVEKENYYEIIELLNLSNDDTITITDLAIIDLTEMFNGDIPQDLLDNPDHFSWYYNGSLAYNTGSLYNSNVSGLMIRGFNQWDEEWELGNIDYTTGQNGVSITQIRTKNYIEVVQNGTYYFKLNGSDNIRLFAYDSNKNYIGDLKDDNSWQPNAIGNSGSPNNTTFNVPSNCCFIRFFLTSSYGTTYNHDICINVSNANLNGQYKPYVENTISVPQTELISAGSVHNNLQVVEGNIVEGEQLYDIVKNVNVGSYTFTGQETWSVYTSSGISVWYSTVLTDALYTNNQYILIDGGGIITGVSAWGGEYSINGFMWLNNGVSGYKRLYFKNTDMTASQVATFMTGRTIYYPLETPTQTIVATDLHFDQVSSLIEQGGTITMLNSGTPTNTTTTFVVKKAVGE